MKAAGSAILSLVVACSTSIAQQPDAAFTKQLCAMLKRTPTASAWAKLAPSADGLKPELAAKLASRLQNSTKNDDWLPMAVAILEGNVPQGIGSGWFRPPVTGYDWAWLKAHFDKSPADNKITRAELPGSISVTHFKALDRNGNGAITSADLKWKKNSVLAATDSSGEVFDRLDADYNGRVTLEELTKFFDKNAGGFDYLTPVDLQRGLSMTPTAGLALQNVAMRAVTLPLSVRWEMFELLMQGDLGDLEPGPSLGEDAPDFNLALMTHNALEHKLELSTERIQLSDAKGKRPVVLVFGSFT